MSGPVLSMAEVARMLGVSKATVSRMAARGALPSIRLPGTSVIRFRLAHLEELLRKWEKNGRAREVVR